MRNNAMLFISIIFLFFSCQKKEEKQQTVEDTTITNVTETPPVIENCYRMVEGKDSIVLNIKRTGDSITGTFNWLPFEKDKKRSKFKGTITNNTANTIAVTEAEGMTNKEELIFSLGEKEARVKFGEMTENKDHLWKYKYPEKTTEQVLQKVDCSY